MPGKILFMEPITLLSGKFFQNKQEHIDRFIDQLLHMADIFLRKRYGLNTFLEYFLQKADMDLCVLTLDDLISIGMILAFDAIRKSISQFHGYFGRPDASLSDSFAPQGLLYPGQMHLYPALLFHRDYFTPVRCISIRLFCSTGITLPRSDASLSGSFVPQGLFRPAECISSLIFCSTGIISTDRMHPITGRPSLKTSLPGHSVNFRFFDLSAILSKHFSVCIFHKIYCRSPCKIHFFPCMAKSLFPPEAII